MKKQIVFWLPQGRLGNLIFQYQAAISLFPENSLIIAPELGFSEVFQRGSNTSFISLPNLLRPRFASLWLRLLRWCVRNGILGSAISEYILICGYPVETRNIIRKSGWLSKCWVVEGWFQYDDFANPPPKIRKSLADSAEIKLSHIPRKQRVAVHLRFGDFAHWEILGKNGVCLPPAYYAEAMREIAKRVSDPVFVIFSDDIKQAELAIGNAHPTFCFQGASAGEDMAGITLCSHAIASASTFSWWGSYCIDNPGRILIGPKYWAGFKSRIWYPLDIESKDFLYIDLDSLAAAPASD